MKSIGGYLGLELSSKEEYHSQAYKVNSGRNAFELILRNIEVKKIWIPYYICEAVIQPLERLGIDYGFYSINPELEPEFEFDILQEKDYFLYCNYFGLKTRYISELEKMVSNLIIDASQSIYSKFDHQNVFYSPRKFFGIPDGGYAYLKDKTNNPDYFPSEKDYSVDRMAHLLKHLDLGREIGFEDFQKNEKIIENLPLRTLSNLTHRLLESIDYQRIKEIRQNNFKYLDSKLKEINLLKFEPLGNQVPLCYPFLANNSQLREKLLSHQVYLPIYWQSVLQNVPESSFECTLTKSLLPLPVDQSLELSDLDRIFNLLK